MRMLACMSAPMPPCRAGYGRPCGTPDVSESRGCRSVRPAGSPGGMRGMRHDAYVWASSAACHGLVRTIHSARASPCFLYKGSCPTRSISLGPTIPYVAQDGSEHSPLCHPLARLCAGEYVSRDLDMQQHSSVLTFLLHRCRTAGCRAHTGMRDRHSPIPSPGARTTLLRAYTPRIDRV